MNIALETAVEKLSKWKAKSPPLLLSINAGDVFLISFCDVDNIDPPVLHLSLNEGQSKLTLTIHGASFEESLTPLPSEGQIVDFERLVIRFRSGGSCSIQEMPNREILPEISTDIIQ